MKFSVSACQSSGFIVIWITCSSAGIEQRVGGGGAGVGGVRGGVFGVGVSCGAFLNRAVPVPTGAPAGGVR